jgi:phospholipid transport system substrate-binding protein
MTTNACAKRGFYPENPSAGLWKAIAFAGGLALGLYSGPLHAAPSNGRDTVQGLYDALLGTMKSGKALGQSGRFTQIEPVIRRSFDIAAMARLSVGPTWASLTEAQRQQLTESSGRYMSAIYADRFDSHGGQKLEVTGEQPASSGVIVKSQIIKANGEPVKVDYMMRLTGDNWLISDIHLDGAISEVATRRSEFAAILKTEGIDWSDLGSQSQDRGPRHERRQNLLGFIVRISGCNGPCGYSHRRISSTPKPTRSGEIG